MHVTPFGGFAPFGSRDMITDCSDPFAVDACFWEIFGHADSLLSRFVEFLGENPQHFKKNSRLVGFVETHKEVRKSQTLYYGVLAAVGRQLANEIPNQNGLAININVVPRGYKQLFRQLCNGRPLTGKVFFRLTAATQSSAVPGV